MPVAVSPGISLSPGILHLKSATLIIPKHHYASTHTVSPFSSLLSSKPTIIFLEKAQIEPSKKAAASWQRYSLLVIFALAGITTVNTFIKH